VQLYNEIFRVYCGIINSKKDLGVTLSLHCNKAAVAANRTLGMLIREPLQDYVKKCCIKLMLGHTWNTASSSGVPSSPGY